MTFFYEFGKYWLLMSRAFSKPENFRIFRKMLIREIDNIGIGSLGLISVISIFMGAVIAIQMAENIDTPLIPNYTIGFATRQSAILEFSTTVVALILSGKVGSNMASELGTMRISEQIDALKIMGINPASHLILPKILGFMIIAPFIVIISMFLCVIGGYIVGSFTGLLSPKDYISGVQLDFKPFHIVYSLIKTVVFGYIISSVSCFYGYYTSGGALEVGISSTKAVVYSIFAVLTLNLMITGLLLL